MSLDIWWLSLVIIQYQDSYICCIHKWHSVYLHIWTKITRIMKLKATTKQQKKYFLSQYNVIDMPLTSLFRKKCLIYHREAKLLTLQKKCWRIIFSHGTVAFCNAVFHKNRIFWNKFLLRINSTKLRQVPPSINLINHFITLPIAHYC